MRDTEHDDDDDRLPTGQPAGAADLCSDVPIHYDDHVKHSHFYVINDDYWSGPQPEPATPHSTGSERRDDR